MPRPTASVLFAQALASSATHPPAIRALLYSLFCVLYVANFVFYISIAATLLFGCFAVVCVFWDVLVVLFGFWLGKRLQTWINQH